MAVTLTLTWEVIVPGTTIEHPGPCSSPRAPDREEAMTDIRTAPRFSAEMWAAFWAAPEMSSGADILADDIVGYWPAKPNRCVGWRSIKPRSPNCSRPIPICASS